MKKRLASPTTTKQQHVTQVDHEFHEERVQNYDAKKEHDGDEVEVVVDGDVKARARIGAGGGGGLLQRVLLRKTSSQQQVYSSKVRMESRMASAAAATCYDEDDDNLEEGVVTIHQSRTKRGKFVRVVFICISVTYSMPQQGKVPKRECLQLFPVTYY